MTLTAERGAPGTGSSEGGGDPLIGAALQGMRMAAAEVEQSATLAETLQRSLLPERLPAITGLDASARYEAGATDTQVGGDWYDLIELRDGLAGIAIGDVVGRGIGAAAKMARLQNALRAYALEGLRPAVVLEKLNGFAHDAAGAPMATVLYGVVDPERGRLHLASAGHPPVLVVGPRGDAHFAEGPTGSPLGVTRFPVYEEATISLRPGATVVLYTDGLVERPGVSLDRGLDWLRDVAADASSDPAAADPGELCSKLLVAGARAASQADDVALLAVRLEPVQEGAMELTLASEPESLSHMRRALGRWLRAGGADDTEAYEIVVACGEACANAIAHAQRATEPSYVVAARRRNGSIELEVRDSGSWRAPRERSHGRGLRLMSQLVDDLEIDRASSGTVVRMRRAVRAPDPMNGDR